MISSINLFKSLSLITSTYVFFSGIFERRILGTGFVDIYPALTPCLKITE